MDQARIERAAALLADARNTGRKLAGFPDDARPATVEEALAVQQAAARINNAVQGAWKVGAPPGATTTYAPIYANDLYASPATMAAAKHPGMMIEGEVAFRLGKDLPAGGRPYSAEQVAAAVQSLCATIEIGESRYADFAGASIPEKIADNLGNGALVYGGGLPDWRNLDLRQLHVTMTVNGRTHVDRTGGKPGDEPFTLLVWAANHLGSAGLKSGALITTGSWTGAYAAQPGEEIHVAFVDVGDVRLRCV